MGYKLAGYDVVGNIEIDPAVMKVYQINNHPKYPFLMDVRDFLKLNPSNIPDELFALDILDGSPPCSVFSMAGQREKGWNREKIFREGQAKQRLDDLFFWFIKIAARLKPKVVIAENVSGLIKGDAKGYVNEIFKAFDDAGYNAQLFLLNSAFMGVPQKRERCFFIAGRKDLKLKKLALRFDEKPIKFGEVRELHGKPIDPNSKTGQYLKYMVRGDKNASDIRSRLDGKKSNFGTVFYRDDAVGNTLVSGGMAIRACDKCSLTDNDIKGIQTFPQDYNFLNQSAKYICGMSVPPVMMAQVAHQVYVQWLKGVIHDC